MKSKRAKPKERSEREDRAYAAMHPNFVATFGASRFFTIRREVLSVLRVTATTEQEALGYMRKYDRKDGVRVLRVLSIRKGSSLTSRVAQAKRRLATQK